MLVQLVSISPGINIYCLLACLMESTRFFSSTLWPSKIIKIYIMIIFQKSVWGENLVISKNAFSMKDASMRYFYSLHVRSAQWCVGRKLTWFWKRATVFKSCEHGLHVICILAHDIIDPIELNRHSVVMVSFMTQSCLTIAS